MLMEKQTVKNTQPDKKNKPGRTYNRIGFILACLAPIILLTFPTYLPLFCEKTIRGGCTLESLGLIIPVGLFALSLLVASFIFFVIGFDKNRNYTKAN